eukprot:1131791-Prymnesium_polylepis.1
MATDAMMACYCNMMPARDRRYARDQACPSSRVAHPLCRVCGRGARARTSGSVAKRPVPRPVCADPAAPPG